MISRANGVVLGFVFVAIVISVYVARFTEITPIVGTSVALAVGVFVPVVLNEYLDRRYSSQ